jgi:Domain of unknown function (DUF6046)
MFTTKDNIDESKNPAIVYLNGIQLPIDVIIGLDGDKVIAESKILDGVAVFERICRKPYEINFEFNCRDQDSTGKYIFPQRIVQELVDDVWKPDQVIPIINSFINSLKIFNVVLQPISFTTIRGNTNIICTIKAKESPDDNINFGTTLIIPL